jgi:glycosyltransferase involved in cell wall biosynthesis
MSNGVTVAYSGVHQAYQISLAIQELSLLDNFYCSIFACPGKWGGYLQKLLGENILHNRRIDGITASSIREYPWPLTLQYLRRFLGIAKPADWELVNIQFDDWVAKQLEGSSSAIFIGVETCCASALKVARSKKMLTLVDWPGVSTSFLNKKALDASREFSLETDLMADTYEMQARKIQELELADQILTCSEFQAETLCAQGVPRNKLQVIPLWVDSTFWKPVKNREEKAGSPLRVLFVGKISLRKGVPYLVQAVTKLGKSVNLTLVGSMNDELKPFFSRQDSQFKLLPACTKTALRDLYGQHDVLVLPSLGDSFGFVALEAMACGLPVIISENCGAPVPIRSWYVPAMDSDSIESRLEFYATNRDAMAHDGNIARRFAEEYSPLRYRGQIKNLLKKILGQQ